MKLKMRKAVEGGNLALIALAIGVLIIVGMYIFTTFFGTKVSDKGTEIGTALDQGVVKTPTSGSP